MLKEKYVLYTCPEIILLLLLLRVSTFLGLTFIVLPNSTEGTAGGIDKKTTSSVMGYVQKKKKIVISSHLVILEEIVL